LSRDFHLDTRISEDHHHAPFTFDDRRRNILRSSVSLQFFAEKRNGVVSRLLVIVAVLLLPPSVSAKDLNKSNSLTMDKDSTAGSWIATCDISVGGIDETQLYSGRMLFEFLAEGQSSSTFIFDANFQVDRANRTWTQSSPGLYEVAANLKGHRVIVHAEVAFDTINSGDRIFCSSRIDLGTQPPSLTLFGANMVSTVQQP